MYSPIAEINLQNLFENCHYIKSIVGSSKLFPVIKANAYGHGAKRVAQYLNKKEIIDGFCVATCNEADELIKSQIDKPIFILGKTGFNQSQILSNGNVIPTIHSFEDINELISISKDRNKLDIQIKVDTGMGRLGISLEKIDKVINKVKKHGINVVGCWSHFSSANDTNQDYSNLQLIKFELVLDKLSQNNIELKYIHIANSSAILQNPNSFFNTVRPGISIYGITPLSEINPNLKPVMKFRLPLIKKINPSTNKNIGYNRLYKTQNNETIGIFQGGYADGVGTIFNNNGFVNINQNLCPIRGKVSMDFTAVDISNLKMELGQYATVWGEEELTLENLSKKYYKIPYEFLVSLSNRVERNYFE